MSSLLWKIRPALAGANIHDDAVQHSAPAGGPGGGAVVGAGQSLLFAASFAAFTVQLLMAAEPPKT